MSDTYTAYQLRANAGAGSKDVNRRKPCPQSRIECVLHSMLQNPIGSTEQFLMHWPAGHAGAGTYMPKIIVIAHLSDVTFRDSFKRALHQIM